MRAFGRWFVSALCLFGLAAGGYHLYLVSHPRRLLVIVDTTYPMSPVWNLVPRVLTSLEKSRYTVFALASDKGPIHGWRSRLELGRSAPYAPRNWRDLRRQLQMPEIDEASEIILITNAPEKELPQTAGWTIIRLASR